MAPVRDVLVLGTERGVSVADAQRRRVLLPTREGVLNVEVDRETGPVVFGSAIGSEPVCSVKLIAQAASAFMSKPVQSEYEAATPAATDWAVFDIRRTIIASPQGVAVAVLKKIEFSQLRLSAAVATSTSIFGKRLRK